MTEPDASPPPQPTESRLAASPTTLLPKTQITEDELHVAAEEFAVRDAYPLNAQIEEFLGASDFNHPIDSLSLAYGIGIGIIVMERRVDAQPTPAPTVDWSLPPEAPLE